MSYFAVTDVSVIDELPPGRSPIETKLVHVERKAEIIDKAGEMIRRGAQVYWVCPLIEDSEKSDLAAAIETYEEIASKLPRVKVGLLHGQMPAEEKTEVMQAFVEGRISLLVATTVIEVGVDVPNATCMVIEHAERFGLAQLHQLRGRVGRGAAKSLCLLLFGQLSETGRARLRIIRETTDGFEIAREDLRLRGPGEFLGARQSGVPLLRFADIEADAILLEKARDFASKLLEKDPERAAAIAKRWFDREGRFLEA